MARGEGGGGVDHLGLGISRLCAWISPVFMSSWLCLCVILSPSIAYILFRVEEILVGAVYGLLLCIAQSVCVEGPRRLSKLSPGRRGQPELPL